MNINITPALTRGISDHYLYEYEKLPNYVGEFFHDEDLDGAYKDTVTWEGLGLPAEHKPLKKVGMDGIRPSYATRFMARTFTQGIVIPIEDKRDDLYGILHKFFPMAGGEFARSYYALKQILAAQFFGLYGFMSGTKVPFMPDGLSLFNTAHPVSLSNQAATISNRPSVNADLSISTAQMMDAAIRTQKRPNNLQPIVNSLKRVMVHPNERLIANQIFHNSSEYGTADNRENGLTDLGVKVVANPFWEYSGSSGGTTSAFNSWFGQGDTHFCYWLNRSDLEFFPRFDNMVLADIITTMMRFAYGCSDWRGMYGSPGI